MVFDNEQDVQPLIQAQCFPYASGDTDETNKKAEPQSEAPAENTVPTGLTTDSEQNAPEEPFPTEDQIKEALSEVNDPEIGMNIIELGLVYDIIADPIQRSVTVNMTLTSPGCPLGPEITSAAYLAITRLKGVKDCRVDLVWTPMWDPETHPTEEARAALGFW
ncbi:MAG: metal-sulfur cluster assembly factor [Candidatus Bruticola sp.]